MIRSPHARWWAMGATALTMLVVGLDMTVLNVALPTIAVDLHASSSQLQWFVDAYTLVMSAMLLPAGMIGDRYGRKRLTLAALAVFGVGSLWCAYAGSPTELIEARALLGLGSAVLIPLAMSAAVVLFEPEERPRAVMVLGLSTMVGLPLGPILAGVLLQHFWWGSVFLVNVPVVAFALVAVTLCMPETRGERDRPIDWVGVVASGLGLLGLTYGVIEAPEGGWADPVTLVPVVGGILVLTGFLAWERRQRHAVPVFDYAVWAVPSFRWGRSVPPSPACRCSDCSS
ncbi:MAG: MFS transporter [Nocardioides sp.]|nr:MFS transporter [Nocardioides sp.]